MESARGAAGQFARDRALDQLATELEDLRIERDVVSYTELAARITEQRILSGASPAAARVARSTVYDAFRAGRSRISPELIADIVRALTNDDVQAERWRERAVRDMVSARELRASARPSPAAVASRSRAKPGVVLSVVIVMACFGLNNLGGQFVADIGVPLYLDMVGTAIAASVSASADHRRGRLLAGRGPHPRLRFRGHDGPSRTGCHLSRSRRVRRGLLGAVFSSNVIISIADKLISGYAALLAVWLFARYGALRPAFGEQWIAAERTRSRHPETFGVR